MTAAAAHDARTPPTIVEPSTRIEPVSRPSLRRVTVSVQLENTHLDTSLSGAARGSAEAIDARLTAAALLGDACSAAISHRVLGWWWSAATVAG